MQTETSAAPTGQLFEPTSFFEGRTSAWGLFEDRFGRVRRRFRVEMSGRWHDRAFHLDESFTYDTGDCETRTWRIVPVGKTRFTATCVDCIGTASGECNADSIRMAYRFRLKLNAREIAVDLDDRIYRVAEGIAINRTTMRKWGIKLGELSLFFQRTGEGPVAPGGTLSEKSAA